MHVHNIIIKPSGFAFVPPVRHCFTDKQSIQGKNKLVLLLII